MVGDAYEMHPIVRDEIYRIGYEAIRNACVHSGANQLDVELRYAHDLALRVSDNGIGIDPDIVDKGKEGHFDYRACGRELLASVAISRLRARQTQELKLDLLSPVTSSSGRRRPFSSHLLRRSESSLSG